MDFGVGVLLSSGEFYSWGKNTDGQLGIPRCYLDLRNPIYYKPENVNMLNDKVKDDFGNRANFGKQDIN